MGNYNPTPPFILGEEWIPLREEPIKFPNLDSDFEVGYTMQWYTGEHLNNARVYTQIPVATPGLIPMIANVYPTGQENGGAVQRLIVPVSSALVTAGSGTWTPSTAAAIADALNPGTSGLVTWTQGGSPSSSPKPRMELFFPFNSYPILNGKRIVGLNIHFLANCYNNVGSGSPITNASKAFVSVIRSVSPGNGNSYADMTNWGMVNANIDATTIPEGVMPLGDYTSMWLSGSNEQPPMPWAYQDLQRFEVTNGDRLAVEIVMGLFTITGDTVQFYELYLEVLYVNETRIATGGAILSPTNLGANVILLRNPTTRVASPSPAAGQYTVTVTNGDAGAHQSGATLTKHSPWNAIRELYAFAPHRGIQINKTQIEGEQFDVELTHILPQVSIHDDSNVALQEPHVYGKVIGAAVYSGVTVNQLISDGQVALGPTATAVFPWVRFYARRFGNTVGPLILTGSNPQITGSVVSITPDQLDALPELVDGWREITLRYPNAPTLGAINSPDPSFNWTSGESFQNRWEVMGVNAPAISGVASNFLNLAASQLTGATYAPQPLVGTGFSSASNISLTWQAPPASTVADDPATDAVILFAQDPQPVTNFAVSTQSQALTGFTDCGAGPCCIPTALSYNKVTWTPVGYGDTFDNRTVAPGGWGNLETGQPWTVTGDSGFSANNFSVSGGTGNMTHSQVSVPRVAYAGSTRDGELTYEWVTPVYALGGGYEVDLLARVQDKNNFYQFTAVYNSNGRVDIFIFKNVAGVFTQLAVLTGAGAYAPGTRIKMRAQFYWAGANQCVLQARIWDMSGTEQLAWDVQAFGDAAFTTAGAVGIKTGLPSSNTNTLPFTFAIDKFTFTPRPGMSSELQRYDPVTAAWQTIARPNPWIAFFNDYEARAGITSSYQIRSIDPYGFQGAWSVTGTGTIAEPGVTMPSCGTNKRGVLIFTSNEDQTGGSNLAYAMTFDADNVETFGFPEASDVVMTQLLDKDYAVAFHGTERGGEQFTRRLLIANAAVALPRLADIQSLRDMAWAAHAYTCVRDDIGDRWFATVIVSDDEVRRNRRLYNANITVIETSATPTQVVVT